MRLHLSRTASLVAALCLTTSLSAFAADAPLSVVLGAEPRSLDPSIENSALTLAVTSAVVDTLARTDANNAIVPMLADSWTLVEPTRWRLKLHPGVKFQDGEPFNADAVAYSLDVFHNTKGASHDFFDLIASAQKVDDLTVDLITHEPTSLFPPSLTFFYIFPPAYYAKVGPEGYGRTPIGTGPWKMGAWTTGVSLTLEPNADYWRTRPNIGQIQLRWASDASTRVALLLNNEVQLANDIPPSMIDRVNSSGQDHVLTFKTARKIILTMDLEQPILNDPRVRKAINHGIDVDSIIKNLFRGHAYGRDKGFSMEGLEGYQGDALEAYSYDPVLAKKLLAEAGYPNGFKIDLGFPIGRYLLDKESAAAIAGQLQKIGVTANLKGMEPAAYFARMAERPRLQGLLFFGCGPLEPTPLWCPLTTYQSSAAHGYGQSAKGDDYMKRIVGEMDDAKRIALLREYENYQFNDLAASVWLWRQEGTYGVNNDLLWKPQPDEKIYFANMRWK